MSTSIRKFEDSYLAGKRKELLVLRDELLNSEKAAEADEADINREASLSAHEYEDDAQRLDALERDRLTASRNAARLLQAERALEKIADGTYGISDLSGDPIALDRLEALPDAVNTAAEQERSEKS